MLRWPVLLLLAVLLPLQPPPDAPAYTADGHLKFPVGYSEWVFLGTGLDMSYTAGPPPAGESEFNTVFANPSAYRAFKQTGQWPEGAMLVLENRAAATDASINKQGKTESSKLTGLEVHLKDSKQHKGDGWAFYSFNGDPAGGKLIARPAACYTCHEQHAAVDTIFTQFYPAALEIAKLKGTLSPEYRQESSGK